MYGPRLTSEFLSCFGMCAGSETVIIALFYSLNGGNVWVVI